MGFGWDLQGLGLPVRAPLKTLFHAHYNPSQIPVWAWNGQTGLARSNPVWALYGLVIWALNIKLTTDLQNTKEGADGGFPILLLTLFL